MVPIPADGSSRWEDCAREAGLVPESIELLSAEYEHDAPAVAALVMDLGRGSYTHLALTSSRALTALKRAGEPLAAVQRVGGFTVAAIGPATAAAAIAAGLSVGLVPAEDHSAHGLAAGLLRTRHAAGSAAIPHSDLADGRLAAELRGAGWRVDEVIAYRIHAALPAVTDWSLRPPDLVFLTSGSAAHAWHQLIAATPAIRGAGAIVLGRGAADAAAALGIPVIATATAADAPSLTRAMRNAREIVNGHNEGGKTRPPPPAPTEGA
nr:uroporphyrinogen-III synthase [Rarobacter faecitabidus]